MATKQNDGSGAVTFRLDKSALEHSGPGNLVIQQVGDVVGCFFDGSKEGVCCNPNLTCRGNTGPFVSLAVASSRGQTGNDSEGKQLPNGTTVNVLAIGRRIGLDRKSGADGQVHYIRQDNGEEVFPKK
jgi:hypothetical protein